MDVQKWQSQMMRGTLEYCVLLLIRKRPYYGYDLLQTLEAYPLIQTKESTIYPLLRRLAKEGLLTAKWQATTEGLPPRKYYELTKAGNKYLQALSKQWQKLQLVVKALEGETQWNKN